MRPDAPVMPTDAGTARNGGVASRVLVTCLGERAAEPAPRLRHLELGGARLDLEGEIEPCVVNEPFEQPVEHRQAGRHVG